jgi:endoglucanase
MKLFTLLPLSRIIILASLVVFFTGILIVVVCTTILGGKTEISKHSRAIHPPPDPHAGMVAGATSIRNDSAQKIVEPPTITPAESSKIHTQSPSPASIERPSSAVKTNIPTTQSQLPNQTTPSMSAPYITPPTSVKSQVSNTRLPLYVDPDSQAKTTANTWRENGRAADATLMDKIAQNATAAWFVGGDDPYSNVHRYVTQAAANNSLPVLVAYNIPGRDCGQYSSNDTTASNYQVWINRMALGIGNNPAIIIVEPDALGLECLQNKQTYNMLSQAITRLTEQPQAAVYMDVASWIDPATMALRLRQVGIEHAQGFALNTSGFGWTNDLVSYGTNLSALIDNKHFVIDTSRNGNGPSMDKNDPEPWCNPPGRALGPIPTTHTYNPLVDAFLWIKVPGESDGNCKGSPPAGQWMPDYALGLAQNSHN